MNPKLLRAGMNCWPPFLFAGVHITQLDERQARVELRARPWNRNYVGTHFGGSLFAMTDPFWMILILRQLGRDHFVWDKAAEIEFVKPGRGTVVADFLLTDETLDNIRAACAGGDKHLLWLPVDVKDAAGEVVARIRKQIYVRRKPAARQAEVRTA
jgi:acyl-coenzyme A thioesterase PaaI-like protein